MKLRVLSALCSLALLTSFQSAPSHAAVTKDFTIPATYPLTKCLTAAELDCIESVGIIDSQGKLIPGKLESELITDTPRVFQKNTIYDGSSTWVANGVTITLRGSIDSPLTFGCNATCAALRIGVVVANPLETKVHFAFRTSWLRPMNVQMKAAESDYTYEKIPGGTRWTMQGKGLPYSPYIVPSIEELNAKKAANAKADFDGTLFTFYIHHAGTSYKDSYWEPICADQGFSVQSHNTDETGDPIWDAANESLIFSIFAPHFKANGDVNTGYFKYWTTHKFMDCKYPTNTLTKSPKLTIEILNEDGSPSVATTAVTNKDGVLYFYASGFHFSSPKILIKAENSASTSSQTTSNTSKVSTQTLKKTTITCVKGKIAKKVTAVNPKCPTGYKKK